MLEPLFNPDSHGYRPGRSAIHAVRSARQRRWRYDWVLDIDIKNFVLLKAVRKHTDCPWVLLYIERWLKARAMRDDGMLGLRERGSTGDFSTRSRQVRVSCCRLQVVGLDLVRSARHNLLRGDNGVVLWGYGWVDRWSGPLT